MTQTQTASNQTCDREGGGSGENDWTPKLEELLKELQSSVSDLTELAEDHPMLVTASAFAIGLTLGLLWRSGK
jgi:hypothetical protein